MSFLFRVANQWNAKFVPGGDKFNGDLSKWDVSSVTGMHFMFFQATKFNGDISKWVTSKVTNMESMFNRATSFNGDLTKWDVSSVVNMGYMFEGATKFNGDLSKWDGSRVTNMYKMFKGATSFAQTLCGTRWASSKADKREMFVNSKGKIGSPSSGCGTCKQ